MMDLAMFSHQRKTRIFFVLCEIALAALAFEIAYRTRIPLHWHFLYDVFYLTAQQKVLVLGASLTAWISIALWLDVYNQLVSGHPRIILRDCVRQCASGALCLLVLEYALRMELSRLFLALYVFLTWAFVLLFRLTAGRIVGVIRKEFATPQYVMVVGTGVRAVRIAQTLEKSSRYGIRLRGFFAESENSSERIVLGANYEVHHLSQLSTMLRQNVIDEIIFAVDSGSLADLEEVFLLCDREGIRTRVAVNFFPHINSTISLERLDETPLLTFSATPNDEIQLLVKRSIDIVIAAAGLLVLTPFMGLIAMLIRLTSPGPAIFRQTRCGLNGRAFPLYKFRSMCENAEELKPSLVHLNTRETAFKIPDDPRTTPLGRYLRKFSIDEWPQLWNVLRGDMSLVGPRPAIPSEVENYQQWQRRRLRMRPGLTCLWALSGRDSLDFETWMKLDMQYIDGWSLGLDWKILFRTIPRTLLGKDAS
jgi:exopolysaccharide biosynthesis polyprenyl glycosylphosphotransferase